MSKQNWQAEGVRLAGGLVDAAGLIQAALPRVRDRAGRAEIEAYLESGGRRPLPSPQALRALAGAVIAASMLDPPDRAG